MTKNKTSTIWKLARCSMNFIVAGHAHRTCKKKIRGRMSEPPVCFGNCYVRSRPEVRKILREDKCSFSAQR